MSLKILVVDPSTDWLGKTKNVLEEEGYVVDVCSNGVEAQSYLYNNKYFTVILNLEVQQHSGIQVLKYIRINFPVMKAIYTINSEKFYEENDITADELRKMGARKIWVHPFEHSNLLDLLEGGQGYEDVLERTTKRDGLSDEVEVKQGDDDFSKIKLDMFHSGKVVLFDIFIRLSENKYLKILHAGDSFDQKRIDKYRDEKKIEYLHFLNKDRRRYLHFYNHITSNYLVNKKAASGKKFKLMKDTTEKMLAEITMEGIKPLVVEQSKDVCTNFFNLVENDENLWKILQNFIDVDPTAYSHSYLVCLYSSMVLKQFDWKAKVIIETVALAAMFHDVGKSKIDQEIIKIRPCDLTEQQLIEYKKHPELGVEMLEGNHQIPHSVRQVILQHHEASDGSGFPHGIKDMRILTLAKIVFLADQFTHRLLDQQVNPLEGLRQILMDSSTFRKYNSIVLENFIKIFVDPQKIKRAYSLPGNSHPVKK